MLHGKLETHNAVASISILVYIENQMMEADKKPTKSN